MVACERSPKSPQAPERSIGYEDVSTRQLPNKRGLTTGEIEAINLDLRRLAKAFARTLGDNEFLQAVATKFAGYQIYSFHLSNFVQNVPTRQSRMLASQLGLSLEQFSNLLSNLPSKVEIFLSPRYRNWKWNQIPIVAVNPIANDSTLVEVPAFDSEGNKISVDAWALPDDQLTLVLHLDERPERSKEVTSLNQYTPPKKAFPTLRKQTIVTGSNGEYRYWLHIQITDIKIFVPNWSEPEIAWPPEFYTKTWFCNNDPCTWYGGLQQRNMEDVPNWDPQPSYPGDQNWHDCTYSVIWEGRGKGIPNKWRVEIWEDDAWFTGGDDFIDRHFPQWGDPAYYGNNAHTQYYWYWSYL